MRQAHTLMQEADALDHLAANRLYILEREAIVLVGLDELVETFAESLKH